MKPRLAVAFLALLATNVAFGSPDQKQAPTPAAIPANAPKMTKETRMDLIRAFNAELVYVRTPFPMGKRGLELRDGKIIPGQQELQQIIAMWGPAVKPGDRAMITDIEVRDKLIHFEINGGPVKKQKWYQRIQISGSGGSAVPLGKNDSTNNPRGSYVDLMFDRYVPEMDPQQLKALLTPVFDFNSKTAEEAYLDTVPPIVKQAIQDHHVLVGMNHEMVLHAKGRPPKKDREKDSEGTEYEEWIYGEPPQDVDFVRFVGDEVVRVENMKVGGEKTVRTAKEVNIETQPTVAKEQGPDARPANAPSLRRPGEAVDTSMPKTAPSAQPLPPAASPPAPGGPNQNPNAPPQQPGAPPGVPQ